MPYASASRLSIEGQRPAATPLGPALSRLELVRFIAPLADLAYAAAARGRTLAYGQAARAIGFPPTPRGFYRVHDFNRLLVMTSQALGSSPDARAAMAALVAAKTGKPGKGWRRAYPAPGEERLAVRLSAPFGADAPPWGADD